ncbi:hypothetical protein ACVWZA_002869 [Sphingomonas sp. UYAg733]
MPVQIPYEQDSPVDTDRARRRVEMQLYSRMMTDLTVLTDGTRVPNDDEINDALRRAARAHGAWSAQDEAAWRRSPGGGQPAREFASFDPVNSTFGSRVTPGMDRDVANPPKRAIVKELGENIDSQESADEVVDDSFWSDGDSSGQAAADQGSETVNQGNAAVIDGKETATEPRAGTPPTSRPSDAGTDQPQSSNQWRAHVTNGVAFKPDTDKTYFAFLLGAEGVSATDRLVELHRNVLNGTSLTDHLLEELHPSDERLAKTLDVMKAGVAGNEKLRAAFGADINRLQAIIDTEQVRASAAYAREAKAFGKAYAIEVASNALGFGAGNVIGKIAPIAIEAAAPSVRAFGNRVGGALSRLSGRAANTVGNEGGTAGRQVLYHYTNEAGAAGIAESRSLNPSLWRAGTKDVRYGNGQYVSDFAPGTKTPAQLSREFLGRPFHGDRFTHYVEIDATGLGAIPGRVGV